MVSRLSCVMILVMATATWSCHSKKDSSLEDSTSDKNRNFEFVPGGNGFRDLYHYMDTKDGLKSDGDHDGDWHDGKPTDSYCHTNHKKLIYSARNHSPTENIISNIDMPLAAMRGDAHALVFICAQAYDLVAPHDPINGSFDITVHAQGRSSNPSTFKLWGIRDWSLVDVGGVLFDGSVDDLDVQIGNITPGVRVFIESVQIAVVWDKPPPVELVTLEHTYDLRDKMGNDRAKIAQLRKLYRLMYNQALRVSDKVFAITQELSLDLLEDDIIGPDADKDARIDLAQQCWCRNPLGFTHNPEDHADVCRKAGLIERLSPGTLGQKVPAYYYFKAACILNWQKARNEFPTFHAELRNATIDGLALDRDALAWRGGSLYRVSAQAQSDINNRAYGDFNLERALNDIDAALSQPAIGGYDSGRQYYENIVTKVGVMVELRDEMVKIDNQYIQTKDILSLLDSTLEEMNDIVSQGQSLSYRRSEFEVARTALLKRYRDLAGKDWVTSYTD